MLDEPTNHLDTKMRDVLEEALADYEGTLLIVSHDRYFLDRVVNKIAHLKPTGLQLYEGNYSEYKAQVQEEAEAAANTSSLASSAPLILRLIPHQIAKKVYVTAKHKKGINVFSI